LLKPFLTEHTILEVLELVIVKSFATGRNLEQPFGQDMASELIELRGRHNGAKLLPVLHAEQSDFGLQDRLSRSFATRSISQSRSVTPAAAEHVVLKI
jgi:hypothetical protein